MALLEVKNLSFSYPGTGKIINNVNLIVEQGDFLVLCGPTGSGKTTLLRLLKPELSPLGEYEGEVLFRNRSIRKLTVSESAKIGFVQQDAEHQTVTDKVWHEVAFGMENLRFEQPEMRRRLAEIMSYFGIDDIFDRNTSELSGGQKQSVALASVMAMNPDLIILDEPTSQLDPVAASEFLLTLKKLNDELGVTIIITEHRLENVIPLCSRVCVLENGKITVSSPVREAMKKISDNKPVLSAMPGSVRLFALLGGEGECPISIKEGRKFAEGISLPDYVPDEAVQTSERKEAIKLKNVCFRYNRDSADVLLNTGLTVYENEILCILGANGSGKTTLLRTMAGLETPYSGKIEVLGKNIRKYNGQTLYNKCIALLPQNAECLFTRNTLREELTDRGFEMLSVDLSHAAETHPYDLSGGEKQLAALAKVLLSEPKILLLDEPTKGLDSQMKMLICGVLKELKSRGVTVIAVTHDVEFAAMCADRAAMFFRGNITCTDTPHKFFAKNIFYTTSVNKILGGNLLTLEDVKAAAEAEK